ncbi:AAEL006111-PB [Aedes aegypti]|uniref:AAEL006111-PA n=1 Tax=Aedes aegypti TaxID=7159 RepID=Q177J3_AEDAE|nr:AAEL006111-PA [Aedes aegypti]EAT42335.1 AAEL006111-PB [Aedes aegypti]
MVRSHPAADWKARGRRCSIYTGETVHRVCHAVEESPLWIWNLLFGIRRHSTIVLLFVSRRHPILTLVRHLNHASLRPLAGTAPLPLDVSRLASSSSPLFGFPPTSHHLFCLAIR